MLALIVLPGFAAEESKAEKARERFQALDTDQSEGLSKPELEAGWSRLIQHFETLDLDKNGELSPVEIREGRRACKGESAAQ
ncbi:MAG: hypothetical protein ACREV9_13320 [Burkholderiales bacterium]